jgi:hypothetical protein
MESTDQIVLYVWFGLVWFLVFHATFNNISVISCLSALLAEEAGVPGENHRPAASHCQALSHNVVSSTPRHEQGVPTHNRVSGDRHWSHMYHMIPMKTFRPYVSFNLIRIILDINHCNHMTWRRIVGN